MDIGMENRRQHYRIRYAEAEGARFVFGSSISEVLECSERGIRFRTVGFVPKAGQPIEGRLMLRHGKELSIAGKVAWSNERQVALHLDDRPIPFLEMMREQLFLRQGTRQTR